MINNQFILRVKEEMKIRKINKAKLARMTGQTAQNLGKMLNNKRNYHQKDIETISKVLNMEPYQLFLSSEEAKKLREEEGKMMEYQKMIELMELVPFFRNQLMARFEDLVENHPEKIREAKKKGPASSMSK